MRGGTPPRDCKQSLRPYFLDRRGRRSLQWIKRNSRFLSILKNQKRARNAMQKNSRRGRRPRRPAKNERLQYIKTGDQWSPAKAKKGFKVY